MSFAATAAVVGAGAAAASAGVAISGAMSGGGAPSYNAPKIDPVSAPEYSNVNYDPMQGSEDLLANLPNLIAAARQITRYTVNEMDKIYPGASAQREQASNIVTDYMNGVVPQDVVDFTNRQVAERSGGGYNPNNGAGANGTQIQSDFGRSLGLTSLQLQQYGMSASQSWQQLSNSFITSPLQTGQLALGYADQQYKYDALNANMNYNYDALATQVAFQNQGVGMDLAQNQYTAGLNNYNATQNANANMVGAIGGASNSLVGLASGLSSSRPVYTPNTNLTTPAYQQNSAPVSNLSSRTAQPQYISPYTGF